MICILTLYLKVSPIIVNENSGKTQLSKEGISRFDRLINGSMHYERAALWSGIGRGWWAESEEKIGKSAEE